jgi:hypothetical protein
MAELTATIRRVQKGQMYRARWAVRLPFLPGTPEGYGATLREAMEAAAEGIESEDEEIARRALSAPRETREGE